MMVILEWNNEFSHRAKAKSECENSKYFAAFFKKISNYIENVAW